MLKKIINYAQYPVCLLREVLVRFIAVFVTNKPFYKELWLISERKSDARDNGWHFFQYMRRNHPEINCAYVIDSKSPDFDKVNAIGKVV